MTLPHESRWTRPSAPAHRSEAPGSGACSSTIASSRARVRPTATSARGAGGEDNLDLDRIGAARPGR